MEKLEMLYEGKAKKVYATDDPELLIVDYKDDATAFNGVKKGTIVGKGVINNQMSNRLMQRLARGRLSTHVCARCLQSCHLQGEERRPHGREVYGVLPNC